jgi:hypothetical protein
MGVVRRLSQLVFVSYAIQITAVLLLRTYLYGNPLAVYRSDSQGPALSPELMVTTSGFIVASVACVLIAIRKLDVYGKLDQISMRATLVCAAIAFVLCACLPTWWRNEWTDQASGLITLFVIHIIFSLVSSYTWLWWVDRFRGTLSHVAAAACAWLAIIMLHPIAARAARVSGRLVFGESYMDAFAGTYATLAVLPFTSFQFGLNGSGLTILYMLLACVVYGAFVRRGRAARAEVVIAD